jgi:hypothetical protein
LYIKKEKKRKEKKRKKALPKPAGAGRVDTLIN